MTKYLTYNNSVVGDECNARRYRSARASRARLGEESAGAVHGDEVERQCTLRGRGRGRNLRRRDELAVTGKRAEPLARDHRTRLSHAGGLGREPIATRPNERPDRRRPAAISSGNGDFDRSAAPPIDEGRLGGKTGSAVRLTNRRDAFRRDDVTVRRRALEGMAVEAIRARRQHRRSGVERLRRQT